MPDEIENAHDYYHAAFAHHVTRAIEKDQERKKIIRDIEQLNIKIDLPYNTATESNRLIQERDGLQKQLHRLNTSK